MITTVRDNIVLAKNFKAASDATGGNPKPDLSKAAVEAWVERLKAFKAAAKADEPLLAKKPTNIIPNVTFDKHALKAGLLAVLKNDSAHPVLKARGGRVGWWVGQAGRAAGTACPRRRRPAWCCCRC